MVMVEAGHVAPRAEKRKMALEAYKKRVAREGIKKLARLVRELRLLSQATGCREVLHNYLLTSCMLQKQSVTWRFEGRTSALKFYGPKLTRYVLLMSQFDQKTKTYFDDLLKRSYTLVLRMKIISFKQPSARRVFLREKRSRFLGQEK